MAGEYRGIDQHIAADFAHSLFFQFRHHIAQILPLEGGISAETGDKVATQHAIRDVALTFQCRGEAIIRPELQQSRQRGKHLLGAGRECHLL
ncbi:hypothetical protein D3C80_1341760 [compost metagenome]